MNEKLKNEIKQLIKEELTKDTLKIKIINTEPKNTTITNWKQKIQEEE